MFDRFFGRGNNLKTTREATAYLYKNFRYLGLKPCKKWQKCYQYLYYLLSVSVNMFVLGYFPLSFPLSYYYESHKMSAEQFLTSLQVFINVLGLPPKVIVLRLLLKRLSQSKDIMNLLDARCLLAEECKKIRECAIMGNRLTVFFMSVYTMYAVVTILSMVCMGQPGYSLFLPIIDWRNSWLEFILQCLIEWFLVNVGCLHQATVDVYAIIYVYILRTHMQILVDRVKRLGTDSAYSNDEHYEQLVLCVKDHQNLLKLVDFISPVISITIFIQFMITAAILGTTLINIFVFADFSAQIASVVYIFAVLVQTSPCCYQATCLIEDSEQLSLAIFHCEWFDKDIRFRKMMIYFMMRSQTPITLTALKLFPITLDTSVGIAKFSFSLYTLIREMDFGQSLKN
ncbi:odorant receptor 7a-like [Lucilia sericata]|uniref:odorant receptor 7a-like n=1 Tax=Lucilia sericata TaxID=13632 RepID=UPI0018A87E52|nr:odorant receptor 7a-like [Lucilia sericata]